MLSIRININGRRFEGYDYNGKTYINDIILNSFLIKDLKPSRLRNLVGLKCAKCFTGLDSISEDDIQLMLIDGEPLPRNGHWAFRSKNCKVIAVEKLKNYYLYCKKNGLEEDDTKNLVEFLTHF